MDGVSEEGRGRGRERMCRNGRAHQLATGTIEGEVERFPPSQVKGEDWNNLGSLQPEPAETAPLSLGVAIRVEGVQAKPELNGKMGMVGPSPAAVPCPLTTIAVF